MTKVEVRVGNLDEVDAAVLVYERSNLVRRQGDWPSRSSRIAEVTASLRDPGSWFLIGRDGGKAVAMALAQPFRSDGGAGAVILGSLFLNLIYVVPEQWGRGIGGLMLDAIVDEAAGRGCHRCR